MTALMLAFVGVIGAEFAYSMRLEATAARVYKETLIATHLAEAGAEQAIRALAGEFPYVGLGNDKDRDAGADCPLDPLRDRPVGLPSRHLSPRPRSPSSAPCLR